MSLYIPGSTEVERAAIAMIRAAFAVQFPHLEMREVGGSDDTSLFLQKHLGDLVWWHKDPSKHAGISFAEVKAETRFTGNVFVETWSNWAEDPSRVTPGWASKIRGHFIFYVFVDKCILYMIPREPIMQWFWNNHDKYPERTQRKASQRNVTRGVLVPLRDIEEVLSRSGKNLRIIELQNAQGGNL